MVQSKNKQDNILSIISLLMIIASAMVLLGYLWNTPSILNYATRKIQGYGNSPMFSGLEGLVVILYAFVSAIAALPYAVLGLIATFQCGKRKESKDMPIIIRRFNVFIANNILLYIASILPILCVDSGYLLWISIISIIVVAFIIMGLYFIKPKSESVSLKEIKRVRVSLCIFAAINIITDALIAGTFAFL